MEEFLNMGIIGVGNIGSAHASSIYRSDVPHMKLCALCDNDSERLKKIRAAFPDVPCYSCASELIESGSVQAVIIATPHPAHPPIAKLAFESGLHVLTEKPAGIDCKSVRGMMEAAKKSGKLFGVMFNQRASNLFRAAYDIVHTGGLGELRRVVWIITNWYRKQAYYDSGDWRASFGGEGGGVLINQAPHNLDLWQWICGMPESIFAKCEVGKYHDIEVEDEATIFAQYENGANAVFITTTGEYPGTNRLEISGTKGKLVIENNKLVHTSISVDEREFRYTEEQFKNSEQKTEIEGVRYNGHTLIFENFARAVLFGEELIASGYEAVNELTLSNAAYLSSWTGKEITLPMDDELFARAIAERAKNSRYTSKVTRESEIIVAYKDKWNTSWS